MLVIWSNGMTVDFESTNLGSIPSMTSSGMAQRKRVWLITRRSEDRNLLPLFLKFIQLII